MTHFIHPLGLCESETIGDGTRIWAFAHVLRGAIVGRDCNICDHVFIEDQVVVGDRVTVKSGVQLWNGLIVEDDVFIGPNATFANDRFPRSKQYQTRLPVTRIRKGASIGAGATILPGVTIGRDAMIGAGSVVTGDVQPDAVVTGNPAYVVRYIDTPALHSAATADTGTISHTAVPGATLRNLKHVEDARGNLAVGEFEQDIPFSPKRWFTIFDVPGSRVRGSHALRSCEQFFVCVKGHCAMVVSNGRDKQELRLDEPALGLHIPAMIWFTMYKFSSDAVLLVFASSLYDQDDYIRDYQDYLASAGVAP